MSIVIDFLKTSPDLKHLINQMTREVEDQAFNFLKTDTYSTDEYKKITRGWVLFRWMDYLTAVKLGKLDADELRLGVDVFEKNYLP